MMAVAAWPAMGEPSTSRPTTTFATLLMTCHARARARAGDALRSWSAAHLENGGLLFGLVARDIEPGVHGAQEKANAAA